MSTISANNSIIKNNNYCDFTNYSNIDSDNKQKSNEVSFDVKFEESIGLLYRCNNNNNLNRNSNSNSNRNRLISIGSNTSSNNTLKCNSNTYTPPDGGYGWLVVFASFMINLICDGISLSFGIIFMEFVEYFGESKSKTAWVGSLFLSIPLITGPVASALTDYFGCRSVAITGSLISSAGFLFGYFSTKLEHLFIAFSISGIGLSLCYVTSIVSVAYYFEKRRSLATGLAVCGTGFGTFLFAPLTIFLLSEYKWRGTLLILSGIFLNIVVFGALMRDIDISDYYKASNDCVNDVSSDNYDNSLFANANKKVNKNNNVEQRNGCEDISDNRRLCSSLINIPTYIRHNRSNSVSNEIISELSYRKGGYLRKLLHNYPKLIGILIPRECDINDLNAKTAMPSTSNNLKIVKTDAILNNKIEVNSNLKPILTKNVNKKERDLESAVKSNALLFNEFNSPLSSNYLRNLRLQRGSLTYRSAMLNIKKYRLKASSAPDLYRNSMGTIDEKTFSFLYNLKDALTYLVDFSNFKSFRYSLFCISNFILYACIDVPYVYVPDQAIINGAADKEAASFLISIIGIFNTFGVVVVGFVGDKPWIDASLLYSFFVSMSGISLAVMPWIRNYLGMALVSALYGFTISANYALVSVILVNIVSIDSFTNAYGLLLLVQGFGSLVGPPIAGWLYDISGNYDTAFYLTGVCVFISGALVAPIAKSSKCYAIQDSSSFVTDSSRPCSPNVDDITINDSQCVNSPINDNRFTLPDLNIVSKNNLKSINEKNGNILAGLRNDSNVKKSLVD